MLVNDECSSWYSRVGDFWMSVWDQRKDILYGGGSARVVGWTNPTPECEAITPTALSAMVVECE